MIRRRFYRAVDVVSAPGGYVLTLDGKPARTPGKAPMLHPKRAIAEAVAAEWRDPEDEIRSETMPLTGLTVAAIDMIGPRKPGIIEELSRRSLVPHWPDRRRNRHDRATKAGIIEELSNFAAGDLLCHHASGPAELIAQQRKYWIPLIVWLGERFDAPLVHTVGILPITQPRESLSSLRLVVREFDDFPLAALHRVTVDCGSLVLSLALAEGHLDAETAWSLGQIDEEFQCKKWGRDAEMEARRGALRTSIAAAARMLTLCREATS